MEVLELGRLAADLAQQGHASLGLREAIAAADGLVVATPVVPTSRSAERIGHAAAVLAAAMGSRLW